MLTTPLNKHGLPLLGRVRHPPRPIAIATPSHLTCHTPACRGLALHTVEHADYCDACLERGFEEMIWRTY